MPDSPFRSLEELLSRLRNLPEGKTQAELARRLGVNPSAVSRIASGRRLVKAHELPIINDFLGGAAASSKSSPDALYPMSAAEAGAWRPVSADPHTAPWGPIMQAHEVLGDGHEIVTIHDDHCDLIAPRGSQALVLPLAKFPGGVVGALYRRDAVAVIVDQFDGVLRERTLREARTAEAGIQLRPRSSGDDQSDWIAQSPKEVISHIVLVVGKRLY